VNNNDLDIPLALAYDDVLLKPQYSDITSRKQVDVSSNLGAGTRLTSPIFASPMDTVSETDMAVAMAKAGGAAIIHRYNTIEQQALMVLEAHNQLLTDSVFLPNIGAAVGVAGDFLERAEEVVKAGANILCVDVAHGHHLLMKNALESLRQHFPKGALHIMAGNVATLEGVNDLADWGADSVRCNIGGGSICSTRVQTGHGMPGLQTIFECARTDRDVKIIADGGIKNSGDITKAIAAGADFVMCGSLLGGTLESPGKRKKLADGTCVKLYRGMASKDAQLDWRGTHSAAEGVTSYVPCRSTVIDTIANLIGGLKSGCSYSNARNLTELRANAQWIQQTSAGFVESKPHIVNVSGAIKKNNSGF